MAESFDFLSIITDAVAEQGEKVTARGGNSIQTRLNDVCGVVSWATVKETTNGYHQASFKLTVDHGPHKGGITWGSVTPTDSEGSLRFLAQVIAAVNPTPEELRAAGFGSFNPQAEPEKVADCLVTLLLGRRIRFSVKPSEGKNGNTYWGADFYKRVGDEDPAPEIEVEVKDGRAGAAQAAARPSLDGPSKPAAAPNGRPAL